MISRIALILLLIPSIAFGAKYGGVEISNGLVDGKDVSTLISADEVPAAETDSAHDECSEITDCVPNAVAPGDDIGTETPAAGHFTSLEAESFSMVQPPAGMTEEACLREDAANGDNMVCAKAQSDIPADYTYYPPVAPGEDGQVLYQSSHTGADDSILGFKSVQEVLAEGAFQAGDKSKLDAIEDGATADQAASEVPTTTTNFNVNLSAADDTVQKALETLDEVAGGGTDDQTAAEVPVSDAGGYFAATNVESALQEVGARIASLPAYRVTDPAYGAKCNTVAVGGIQGSITGDDATAGCSITATDSTLTCTSGMFGQWSAGNYIYVMGAGSAGSVLLTTISSVTSASIAELTDAAATTVTYKTMGHGKAGCSIVSSNNTLSCTTGSTSFSADDIGKPIIVVGAGSAGVTLSTTIASINSSLSVELTDAASTTVYFTRTVFGDDDTTAIQAAITAAVGAGGGDVQVPTGCRMTYATIQNDNVYISGDPGAVIYHAADSGHPMFSFEGTNPTTTYIENIGIRNLDIRAEDNVSDSPAIYFNSVVNPTVENIIINDMFSGILFGDAYIPIVDNFRMYSGKYWTISDDTYGMRFASIDGAIIDRSVLVMMTNTQIKYSNGVIIIPSTGLKYGLDLEDIDSIMWSNLHINFCLGHDIYAHPGSGIQFGTIQGKNTYLDSGVTAGLTKTQFLVDTSAGGDFQWLNIDGGQFWGGGASSNAVGLTVNGGQNISIKGMTIDGFSDTGVKILGGKDIRINDNTITNSTNYNVYVGDDMTEWMLNDNSIGVTGLPGVSTTSAGVGLYIGTGNTDYSFSDNVFGQYNTINITDNSKSGMACGNKRNSISVSDDFTAKCDDGMLTVSDKGLELDDGDNYTDCSGFPSGYGFFADTSDGKIKKCQNGTLTDADTGGTGGGSPGGSDHSIQANDGAGGFEGTAWISNPTTSYLNLGGASAAVSPLETWISGTGYNRINFHTFSNTVGDAVGAFFTKGRGTVASPSAVQSGDYISSVASYGQYDGTVGHFSGVSNILTLATENYSSTAHGSQMLFQVSPDSTVGGPQTAMTIDQDKSVTVVGGVTSGGGFYSAFSADPCTASGTGDVPVGGFFYNDSYGIPCFCNNSGAARTITDSGICY